MPPVDGAVHAAGSRRDRRGRIRAARRIAQGAVLLLRGACLLFPVVYLAVFFWIVWSRARYPFDLEWMEGGMVDHVRFLLTHHRLYVAPSLEFVPYVYNPLYYLIAAALTWVFGVGYLPLRLVSIAGTLACYWLVYWLVRRETGSREAGYLSMGLFAATYALSGGWLDVARVDSLHFAFCLAAVLLVRFARSRGRLVAAAISVWLAFETKQSGVGIAAPLGLYLLLLEGIAPALWFLIPLGILVGGSILLLNLASGGWYWFYAFTLTGQLASHFGRSVWRTELFGNFPLALALGFFYFASRRAPSGTKARWFYALVSLAFFAIAVRVRAHAGSWLNDNLTAHAAVAILAGLGAHSILASAGKRRRPVAGALVYGALLAQFLLLLYNPSQWIPTDADRREGERLEAFLKESPGPVLLTHRGYLGWRLGKGSYAHQMAVSNLLMAPGEARGAKEKVRGEFEQALKEKRFSAVITDWDDFPFKETLLQSYDPAPATYVQDKNAFWCPTGARLKPLFFYLPKP